MWKIMFVYDLGTFSSVARYAGFVSLFPNSMGSSHFMASTRGFMLVTRYAG